MWGRHTPPAFKQHKMTAHLEEPAQWCVDDEGLEAARDDDHCHEDRALVDAAEDGELVVDAARVDLIGNLHQEGGRDGPQI